MRKIALLFLDTFLDANFNFLVFLGRPGRDPGHDPTQNLGHDRDPVMTHNTIFLVFKGSSVFSLFWARNQCKRF